MEMKRERERNSTHRGNLRRACTRAHACMHIYAREIHGALSRACVQERCVKWANLYLSDIEYSYRGAHSVPIRVYIVCCVLTARAIVPLGIRTTGFSVCIWVGPIGNHVAPCVSDR